MTKDIPFLITASTGTAVFLINGQIFHGTFAISELSGKPRTNLDFVTILDRTVAQADLVMVDEISILSGLFLRQNQRVCIQSANRAVVTIHQPLLNGRIIIGRLKENQLAVSQRICHIAVEDSVHQSHRIGQQR
jgi:hypothetical protein